MTDTLMPPDDEIHRPTALDDSYAVDPNVGVLPPNKMPATSLGLTRDGNTDVRLSLSFSFENNDDPRAQALYEYIVSSREKYHDSVMIKISEVDPVAQQIYLDYVAYMVEQPGFVEYMMTHVLPEKFDLRDPELREELTKLLYSPAEWLDTSAVIIGQWEGRATTDFPLKTVHMAHVDDQAPPGALRLGMSPHYSIQRWDGLHEHAILSRGEDGELISPQPIVDSEGVSHGGEPRQSDPGTLEAWAPHSDVHARPQFTREELKSFGGERFLATGQNWFDQMFHKATQNAIGNAYERTMTGGFDRTGSGL